MKRILLLGDSIRISYQPMVEDILRGAAEVTGPEENCRFAKYTLWGINGWMEKAGTPDIIHWNNGLWDVYHINRETGIFTALDEYIHDIGRILVELRKTGARIIWATTTPVDDECVNCRNNDIDQYNEAVARYMKKEKLEINDLNKLVKSNISEYISKEDHLHLTKEGQAACADMVAGTVLKYI